MDARINMPNSFDGTVKLTKQELGRARYEKLKQLDNSGSLLHCKTRKDIIGLMGLSVKQGHPFIQRAIKTGRLQEILIKKTGRQSEYEYHFVNRKRSRTPAKKLYTFAETWHTQPNTQPDTQSEQTKQKEQVEQAEQENQEEQSKLISVEIKGITIKAEVKDIVEIIKSL